ncbi:cytochrome b561 and DOMON domain-containing protein At5g47530-like [Salvia hispanica]|uniref:cytochrome b561 and DOMON domain-containing protein At5g47530-like n=1 Tax=Salvia hispanica TaxID=49212 RepID=UPI00200974BE|nr:cytochrome b561 and DOMON domain-containing protein At5g47530-like [Salvia hispanica]
MLRILPLLLFFSLYISSSHAQSCATYNFAGNRIFSHCADLPNLNSFLHWNYDDSAKTVQIGYRHTGVAATRWVAWAINPTGRGMVGAQALVAFRKSDGTMRAYTSPVSSYQTQLAEGDLSFPVSDLSATYAGNEYTIFATLKLDNVTSTVNQVWQEGPLSGDSPARHPTTGANVQSTGNLNLLSGQTGGTTTGSVDSRTKKKNIHGVLNSVSWGILLPIGAITARYLKVFPAADPAWFYLHALFQSSAYIIGVAGWATGLQLGSQSAGITYTAHRIIGIVIFCLATLQVSALFLRPKKEHKWRLYWNIYHHFSGYSVIVLSIVNIFKGFDILHPDQKWRRSYVGILIGLAALAAILEVYTWYVVLKRKKSSRPDKMSNGNNGYNGYGAGDQDRV